MKKLILTALGALSLILCINSCKKENIAPEVIETTSTTIITRDTNLYRDITFNIITDSLAIYINDKPLFELRRIKGTIETSGTYAGESHRDTLINYIGTKLFYPGDKVEVRAKGYANNISAPDYYGFYVISVNISYTNPYSPLYSHQTYFHHPDEYPGSKQYYTFIVK